MKVISMHDYVVFHLQLMKGRWAVVAEDTGVPKRTIEKIARREIEDPGITHMQKLHDYFRDGRQAQAAR